MWAKISYKIEDLFQYLIKNISRASIIYAKSKWNYVIKLCNYGMAHVCYTKPHAVVVNGLVTVPTLNDEISTTLMLHI